MPNPPDIKTFARRVDPNKPKRGYYVVLTQGDGVKDILQPGEDVVSFTVSPTSEATAAGLRVLTDTEKLPRYADLVFGFWIDIDPAMKSNLVFNSPGAVLGVEISFTTSLGQEDQYTVGIRVVNK
jgi:hypothetical protein